MIVRTELGYLIYYNNELSYGLDKNIRKAKNFTIKDALLLYEAIETLFSKCKIVELIKS
jgi:hypothetical protein